MPVDDSIEKSDLLVSQIQGVFIASIVAMPHEKSSCKLLKEFDILFKMK
jgi:hypothetical protein